MNFHQLNEQICNEGIGTSFKNWWRMAQSTGLGTSGHLFSGVSDEDYQIFRAQKDDFQEKVIKWMEENKREKPMWGAKWLAHAMDQVKRFGSYVPGQL